MIFDHDYQTPYEFICDGQHLRCQEQQFKKRLQEEVNELVGQPVRQRVKKRQRVSHLQEEQKEAGAAEVQTTFRSFVHSEEEEDEKQDQEKEDQADAAPDAEQVHR